MAAKKTIVVEAKNSIVRDVLNEELPLAIENDKKLGQEVDKMLDVVVIQLKQN